MFKFSFLSLLAVHELLCQTVPLYGCIVKNTKIRFFAFQLENRYEFFFVIRNFGQRVRVCWWNVEAVQEGDNVDLIIPNFTYERIVMLFFEIFQYRYFKTLYRYFWSESCIGKRGQRVQTLVAECKMCTRRWWWKSW